MRHEKTKQIFTIDYGWFVSETSLRISTICHLRYLSFKILDENGDFSFSMLRVRKNIYHLKRRVGRQKRSILACSIFINIDQSYAIWTNDIRILKQKCWKYSKWTDEWLQRRQLRPKRIQSLKMHRSITDWFCHLVDPNAAIRFDSFLFCTIRESIWIPFRKWNILKDNKLVKRIYYMVRCRHVFIRNYSIHHSLKAYMQSSFFCRGKLSR